MLARLGKKLRRFRKKISRSEWAARHFSPPAGEQAGEERTGLLIIQIDGLGYDQLQRALQCRRLPFLNELTQRRHHVLKRLYSGMPSATPAVQGELFYGVKSAVPAFQYIRRSDRQEFVMFDSRAADTVAGSLKGNEPGLLASGSSYGNIFTGDAREARFCVQTMNLASIFSGARPDRVLLLIAGNIDKILRTICLAILEAGLAVSDFCRGVFDRKNIVKELKFIPSRIGVCIILRELIRLHVKMDLARGLPVIHANFVGYDEHAHRRNPSSAFAHWTLKGIDGVIRDLASGAARSDRRQYRLLIYSDHGQESAVSYSSHTGRTLGKALKEVFSAGALAGIEVIEPASVIPYAKLQMRSVNLFRRRNPAARANDGETGQESAAGIRIAAMGPLGHIYLPGRLGSADMRYYADRLISLANVPLVLYRDPEKDVVLAHTRKGACELLSNAKEILGMDHPFPREAAVDLARLCRHRDGGDFLISGWRPDGPPLTFPVENGAHGGPGRHESCGFVIMPSQLDRREDRLRPLDLHQRLCRVIRDGWPVRGRGGRRRVDPGELRVITYNIHGCTGLDGKILPERIAAVIARQLPDLAALQEVDRHRRRSRHRDQAAILADLLDMRYSFYPVLETLHGEYGLAILSRHPFTLVRNGLLPAGRQRSEKRGAVWLRVKTPSGPLNIFNTHLSLYQKERLLQIQTLLGDEWLGAVPEDEPVVFCGDFNTGPRSSGYARLTARLKDAQMSGQRPRPPQPTFFSPRPLFRLDHIFYTAGLQLLAAGVLDDPETRLASDHLPVYAVFQSPEAVESRKTKTEGGSST